MSWFPAREWPLMNGANVVGQSVGVTLSVFTAAFIADLIGWRETPIAFGLVTRASTVLFALFARDATSLHQAEPPSGEATLLPDAWLRELRVCVPILYRVR